MSDTIDKKISKEITNLQNDAVNEIDSFETPEKPSITINYDVKNTEEEEAFLTFQKKYVRKSNILKTVAFGILASMFVYNVARVPDNAISWVCLAVCLAVIFITWYNPYKIRKTLMESLKPLEDDKYIFKMYNDYFSIETDMGSIKSVSEVVSDDNTDAEAQDEQSEQIPPRIIRFDDIGLQVLENKKMFILFLKKETIFVLPKRCMTEYDKNKLIEIFTDKLDEDFQVDTVNA